MAIFSYNFQFIFWVFKKKKKAPSISQIIC